MSKKARYGVVLVALLALWFLWSVILGGLRGDPASADLAEAEAQAAEDAAESAEGQLGAANSVLAQSAGGVDHLIEYASQLPEIPVERPNAIVRWYERELMTPAELRTYSDNSAESIEIESLSYFSNNQTCFVGETADDLEFDITACQPQGEPTVVLGKTAIEISLSGWRLDCRAAVGWIFSRFFETIDDGGTHRPSGYHLKPWVAPGTFEGSVPQCLNAAQIEALRRQIGVVYGVWPIDEEGWLQGQGKETQVASAGSEEEDLSVTAKFTFVFRPAHSRLCVYNLVGYLNADASESESAPVLCPAADWIAELNERHARRDPNLAPDRVCFPRAPIATAVPNGDEISAAFDPYGMPAASWEGWPESLDACDIPWLDTDRTEEDPSSADQNEEP